MRVKRSWWRSWRPKGCKKVGINDYLVKPFDFEKAQFVMKKWLGCELQPSAILSSEPNIVLSSDVSKKDNDKILDSALCIQIANKNEEIAKQLWQVLSKQLPEYLENLKKSFESKNVTALHNFSHRLKGAATYAAAPRLRLAATNLSDATRTTKVEMKDIQELYNKVINEILEVLLEFKRLGY